MYCKTCGKEIADGMRFCKNCGAPAVQQSASTQSTSLVPSSQPVVRETVTPTTSPSQPSHARTSAQVVGSSKESTAQSNWTNWVAIGADILFILLTFTPWLVLNLVVWSDSFSLPEIVQLFGKVDDLLGDLGKLYSGSDVSNFMKGALLAYGIGWLVALWSFGEDAFKRITKKKFDAPQKPMQYAVGLAVWVIVVTMVINRVIASNIGIADIVSYTGVQAIYFVGGIIGWIVLVIFGKTNSNN